MNRAATTAAAAAVLAFAPLAAPAGAQGSTYVRFSVGAAWLQSPGPSFSLEPVTQPGLAVGYVPAGRHALELSASRLDTEVTAASPPGGEAPLTIGVRATPLELAYQYRLPLATSRLQPRAGVGLFWARLVDRWRSDTPTEYARSSVHGVSASLAVAVEVAGRVAAVGRARYQFAAEAEDRPVRHIGLDGYLLDVGLELGF